MATNDIHPADRVFQRDQPDADGFRAGTYLHRRRGCVDLPVRCWFGLPIDPATGEEGDRSPRWQVTISGVPLTEDERVDPDHLPASLLDVWPRCQGEGVVSGETDYRQARVEHGQRYDPADPFGHHYGRVNLLTATIPD